MILDSEVATADLAKRFAPLLRPGDVVTLSGSLGAGKTSFVRHLLHALGHEGEVPSPSFAIVQPYDDLVPPVWHTDLFRVEDRSEMVELGLDSLEDTALLVEWPERAGEGMWPEALRLTLTVLPDERRSLTAEVPAAWEGRWPPR
ncbi:tRNA (adenosine(37)-N6)-threonylcarbamoyltransferase complex ATPase subunit type 1 TsaE [Sphingomonas sp. HDW15A]|uniref:tRNA (adenosine(37)-N6)-threonylcarbamoyltransferase complex ATPase subunit type 1 TsaE n=1 Tax=Sphingomonas sp. HDW15A TaxID=2714942 RepID=UPI00140DB735|nr:tRNA (adenosine(37)-N6)-threonylcarbamoyltransferase complex ATPase subunit type 1 TsaE [Sphingomonas sp. HDW15A]QIK95964.1 tRNA (adenosine(37)-N6)-threonylcarbamoyltransferase complex ATPase subunit type 1 TsaE [Sphingomonas sp. HDW15A]